MNKITEYDPNPVLICQIEWNSNKDFRQTIKALKTIDVKPEDPSIPNVSSRKFRHDCKYEQKWLSKFQKKNPKK